MQIILFLFIKVYLRFVPTDPIDNQRVSVVLTNINDALWCHRATLS